MSDAAVIADTPHAVSEVRSAGKFLFWAGVVLMVVWVLGPIYLLFTNALSSPTEVAEFPKHWAPSFDLGSLKFFITFGGVVKALTNSIIVAALTMIDESGARSRSHGIRVELLRAQTEALGIRHVLRRCDWPSYETEFAHGLRRFLDAQDAMLRDAADEERVRRLVVGDALGNEQRLLELERGRREVEARQLALELVPRFAKTRLGPDALEAVARRKEPLAQLAHLRERLHDIADRARFRLVAREIEPQRGIRGTRLQQPLHGFHAALRGVARLLGLCRERGEEEERDNEGLVHAPHYR